MSKSQGSPGRTVRASIVIPVFNQPFFTRVCLSALHDDAGDAEVIVVDNGSEDVTSALLARWAAADTCRRVLRNPVNMGFAAACNRGAATTSADVLVFLNNDTFVLPGWLDALLAPFDDPTIAVTGSLLLYPDGRVQHAGLAFDSSGPKHAFLGLPGDANPVLRTRECQAVTGASMAIRSDVFRSLRGFDERYRNSFEDVDLCLRVREGGGRILYVPGSVAYHFEGMSEGRHGPADVPNHQRFLARWHGRYANDLNETIRQASDAGYEASGEVPRRLAIDRERRLEAELSELRLLVGLRSVRIAVALQSLFRRLLPARR